MEWSVFMRLKNYKKTLIGLFIFGIFFTGIYSYKYLNDNIPDEINVYSTEDAKINLHFPISFEIKAESVEASSKSNNSSGDFISEKYNLQTKIFGLIPAKTVEVNVIDKTQIMPCGIPIGIYLQTNGVMIIGTGKVTDSNGNVSYPAENIILENDYIFSLNDIEVNTKSQLTFLINKYGSKDIILGIRRNGNEIKVKVTPVCVGNNEYKIGIWVRDDSQGIGTLTFITKDGKFGALGHGISDVDTGKLLGSINGILYKADIWGIKKGKNGSPGGLLGSISYEKNKEYGTINSNTNHGIFGQANEMLINECTFEYMDIGLKQDVKKGKAIIRCTVDGTIKDYEIEIIKVDYSNSHRNKGMVIEITDEELLDKTGGIVQGMSGSPIVQNGKIIGAVTHVFINNSTKGYGIFIENMLKH